MVTSGPRRTTRPNERVCGSGSVNGCVREKQAVHIVRATLEMFFDVVKDEIEKLVIAFEGTND